MRNHIKVEQQLKLHIEVLQEKIEDLEKEKLKFDEKLAKEKLLVEKKLKTGYQKIVDSKEATIAKLKDQMQKQLEQYASESFERSRTNQSAQQPGNATAQVKVVRKNNFVESRGDSKKARENAQSHSPSGLGAGSGSKDSSILPLSKVKKGLKVVNAEQKNPYINNVF